MNKMDAVIPKISMNVSYRIDENSPIVQIEESTEKQED